MRWLAVLVALFLIGADARARTLPSRAAHLPARARGAARAQVPMLGAPAESTKVTVLGTGSDISTRTTTITWSTDGLPGDFTGARATNSSSGRLPAI